MQLMSYMQSSLRQCWVIFHRWAGLVTAPFLIITGLTGAVISWDHELDDWLNPHLRDVHTQGELLSPVVLAERMEREYPEIRVASIPLNTGKDESLVLFAMPKQNPATGKLYAPGFNQIFLDPITGEEMGKREWGAVWPLNSENFVSFLYKLHYSLHLPEMFGTDRWGIWLLGIIAIIWVLDCFVGFYLTLPVRQKKLPGNLPANLSDNHLGSGATQQLPKRPSGFWNRWKKAWRVRVNSGKFKFNYDIHRAFGLWTWILLLVVAFSAVSLNLRREVFLPLLSSVTTVSPGVLDKHARTPLHEPVEPKRSYAEILPMAIEQAKQQGWQEPAGRIGYFMNLGVYAVDFYMPDADHGVAGGGHKRLLYDGQNGELLGQRIPWTGTGGDIFAQAQFPMHSGRILGLGGRIMISVMGVIVAMLSITGIYIWWKKRKARLRFHTA